MLTAGWPPPADESTDRAQVAPACGQQSTAIRSTRPFHEAVDRRARRARRSRQVFGLAGAR
ncbi:hypothetical protein BTZ20_2154 [Rhodococcus sp. MTM3W5.2]|nr:hypothetical protein BTZ20_2154 [Rhodococcus sp. MTM3W5.2]